MGRIFLRLLGKYTGKKTVIHGKRKETGFCRTDKYFGNRRSDGRRNRKRKFCICWHRRKKRGPWGRFCMK